MNDKSEVEINHDNQDHVYSTSTPDRTLYDFVNWANKGIGQAITICVNGTIYSGQLIGGYEWCDIQIESAKKQITGIDSEDHISKAVVEYYNNMKNEYYSTDGLRNLEHVGIHYIHLKNARIFDGFKISDVQMTWRFKIGEVDGFSVGSLSNK